MRSGAPKPRKFQYPVVNRKGSDSCGSKGVAAIAETALGSAEYLGIWALTHCSSASPQPTGALRAPAGASQRRPCGPGGAERASRVASLSSSARLKCSASPRSPSKLNILGQSAGPGGATFLRRASLVAEGNAAMAANDSARSMPVSKPLSTASPTREPCEPPRWAFLGSTMISGRSIAISVRVAWPPTPPAQPMRSPPGRGGGGAIAAAVSLGASAAARALRSKGTSSIMRSARMSRRSRSCRSGVLAMPRASRWAIATCAS
mmetsp:Transcript_73712/g.205024  ORF Transcript_73712/g.205024 Transcript_73712/m.205024 type:complete len:263 (+) Transcript_73712:354-1142(+)